MKIKKEQYAEIADLYFSARKTMKEIAKAFGVSVGRISQIVKQLRQEKNNSAN